MPNQSMGTFRIAYQLRMSSYESRNKAPLSPVPPSCVSVDLTLAFRVVRFAGYRLMRGATLMGDSSQTWSQAWSQAWWASSRLTGWVRSMEYGRRAESVLGSAGSGYASCVGRVVALAVALGIGSAVAWAQGRHGA
jgi:hypothetical protein